jgi:hypothetical protein
MVTGGYGPQLVNESLQHRPFVHPALNEAAALEKAAHDAAEQLLKERDLANRAGMIAFAQMETAKAKQQEAVESERVARAKADAELASHRVARGPAATEEPAPAAPVNRKTRD